MIISVVGHEEAIDLLINDQLNPKGLKFNRERYLSSLEDGYKKSLNVEEIEELKNYVLSKEYSRCRELMDKISLNTHTLTMKEIIRSNPDYKKDC